MVAEYNRRVAEFAELRIEKQSIPFPHHIAKSHLFVPGCNERCELGGFRRCPKIGLSPRIRSPEQLFYLLTVTGIDLDQIITAEQAGLDLSVRGNAQARAVGAKLSVVHGPDHLHLGPLQEVLPAPVHLARADAVRLSDQAALDAFDVSRDAQILQIEKLYKLQYYALPAAKIDQLWDL
jgi:hypothetical protein